ncbi:MAG: pyridoxal-phosphate dependent enzyme [Thiobacillus sp.]|nr:pyridoxal-phosphate dependent enzyme [Thiobacillus sp.]
MRERAQRHNEPVSGRAESVSDFESRISEFPRVALFSTPTPIERLSRIEEALGDALRGVRLYIKRDDTMGLGGGGNKLRKLEFLLGEARQEKADTIIAVGGRQSNHARLTAAAAARHGFQCELALAQVVPRMDTDYQESGNILLDNLFGARVHDLPGSANPVEFAEERAAVLRAEGRTAYVMASGGSSPTGCLGYAVCANEIAEQARFLGIAFDEVVVPNGSSGTHAGLAAGFVALGSSASRVRSFSVLASEEDSRAATLGKARATAALLGCEATIEETDIRVDGSERGSAYGAPTASMVSAVQLMARREGLLLDPVYSGKAFAGLLAAVRNGDYRDGASILFVMTGGAPSLFAYRHEF